MKKLVRPPPVGTSVRMPNGMARRPHAADNGRAASVFGGLAVLVVLHTLIAGTAHSGTRLASDAREVDTSTHAPPQPPAPRWASGGGDDAPIARATPREEEPLSFPLAASRVGSGPLSDRAGVGGGNTAGGARAGPTTPAVGSPGAARDEGPDERGGDEPRVLPPSLSEAPRSSPRDELAPRALVLVGALQPLHGA